MFRSKAYYVGERLCTGVYDLMADVDPVGSHNRTDMSLSAYAGSRFVDPLVPLEMTELNFRGAANCLQQAMPRSCVRR